MKNIHVAAAVIVKDNKVFSTQRGYGEFKDLWEFPGGKINDGEKPEETVVREIKEELDTDIKVLKYITTVEHDYESFHLIMDLYLCEVVKGKLELKEHESARWLSKEEIDSVEWLEADLKALDNVKTLIV